MNYHYINENMILKIVEIVSYHTDKLFGDKDKSKDQFNDNIDKIISYMYFILEDRLLKSTNVINIFNNIVNYLKCIGNSIYYSLFNYIHNNYNVLETDLGIIVVRKLSTNISINDFYRHSPEIDRNFRSAHVPTCVNNTLHKCTAMSLNVRLQPICYPNGEKIIYDQTLFKSYYYIYSRATDMIVKKKKIHNLDEYADTIDIENNIENIRLYTIKRQIQYEIKNTENRVNNIIKRTRYLQNIASGKFDTIFKCVNIWKLETDITDKYNIKSQYEFLSTDLFKKLMTSDTLLIPDFSIEKYKDDLIQFMIYIKNNETNHKIIDQVILNVVNTDEFLMQDNNTILIKCDNSLNYIPNPFHCELDIFEQQLPQYTPRINPIFNLVRCSDTDSSTNIPIDETISHCAYCNGDILCRFHESRRKKLTLINTYHPLTLDEVLKLYNTDSLFRLIFYSYFNKMIRLQTPDTR